MDMFCPRCLEPWDNETFHEEADQRTEDGMEQASYRLVVREFRRVGCGALRALGIRPCTPEEVDPEHKAMVAAAFDLMGDDTDGAMAMMEDLL